MGFDYMLQRSYVLTRRYDRAIEKTEHVAGTPSAVSADNLNVDPLYDPLRDRPRFRVLLTRSAR
jgi:hypothetical protein